MENTLVNTGKIDTSKIDKTSEYKNKIIYDYLSITSKIHSRDEMAEEIGMQNLTWQNSVGAKGYKFRDWFGGVNILYGGRPEVWLEMPGTGCRSFETYGNGSFENLFDIILEEPEDIHITRLDIAYDDFEGILNIDQMVRDIRAGNSVSKAVDAEVVDSFPLSNSNDNGVTINVGSDKSEFFIRIYDKRAERLKALQKQGEDTTAFIANCPHWVRVEMQLRRERAFAWVKKIREGKKTIGEMFSGVLLNYLRFVVKPRKGADTNRWRWEIKPYWKKLLGKAEAIRLYSEPGTEYNLQKLDHFVHHQIGNAIYTSIQVHGIDKFLEILKAQKPKKMNSKYTHILENVPLFDPDAKPANTKTREEIRAELYKASVDRVNHCVVDEDPDEQEKIITGCNQQRVPVVSKSGFRWVKCEKCGAVMTNIHFTCYGGKGKVNLGLCYECAEKEKEENKRAVCAMRS